jgi:hypothetical protein
MYPIPGIELPPIAPVLMQSLRAVGYTLSSALADLIDNSIAASCSNVEIDFDASDQPRIVTMDNGLGMDEATLVASMRFGSRDARETRLETDLGRFGLGLKTASLSQCRRFTVLSLQKGVMSSVRWDLDECERRGTWWLGRPTPAEAPAQIVRKLADQNQGTAVIWEGLDRLAAVGSSISRTFDRAMEEAADHLALTFHRFLAGEMAIPLTISLNGRPLPRIDPFLMGHGRGQALHGETFGVEGHDVTISPFVLPFPSRLKQDELDRAGGREALKTGHGFYVYRAGRLVVPGGWFKIVPSDELMRLARVRVDVPVALDHLWKVDIRKVAAEPPPALRPHLRRIVGEVTSRSRRVYTHKGTPRHDGHIGLWRRHDGRDGSASWIINREHPAVASLILGKRSDGDIERLLKLVEASLPAHDIHLHISNDLPVTETDLPLPGELLALAKRMVEAFADQPEIARNILAKLPLTSPFDRDPEGARRIAESLSQ